MLSTPSQQSAQMFTFLVQPYPEGRIDLSIKDLPPFVSCKLSQEDILSGFSLTCRKFALETCRICGVMKVRPCQPAGHNGAHISKQQQGVNMRTTGLLQSNLRQCCCFYAPDGRGKSNLTKPCPMKFP